MTEHHPFTFLKWSTSEKHGIFVERNDNGYKAYYFSNEMRPLLMILYNINQKNTEELMVRDLDIRNNQSCHFFHEWPLARCAPFHKWSLFQSLYLILFPMEAPWFFYDMNFGGLMFVCSWNRWIAAKRDRHRTKRQIQFSNKFLEEALTPRKIW